MQQDLGGRLAQIVDELVRRGVTLEQARREFERQYIVACLKWHDGSYVRCAQSLGVHRNTLRNKVTTLGIGNDELSRRASSRADDRAGHRSH